MVPARARDPRRPALQALAPAFCALFHGRKLPHFGGQGPGAVSGSFPCDWEANCLSQKPPFP